ncbi:MAG: LPS export ABC transporter permease LptG [Gammaproteobacteria bacterium]|nr:MAG: LPS export ABC transporter permease LptG [Gammaproteobacteria bacterium]
MKTLDRHLAAHVLRGSSFALIILLSISVVFEFMSEVDSIGTGRYSLLQSLLYTILTAPRHAYDLLPMAAVVGSLLTLGTMATYNEFIVIRSAGVSTRRIVFGVMKAGIWLVLAAFLLGEVVLPYSEPYAQNIRSFAKYDRVALRSDYGVWARDRNSFLNIRKVYPGGNLEQLSIYEFDESHKLRIITKADSAQFVNDQWLLRGVTQTRLGEQGLETVRHNKAGWGALLGPELLGVLSVKPQHLSILTLSRYVAYLKKNAQDAVPYEFAFWEKLVNPVAILVMLLLAMPFVFGPVRSTGAGHRILIGILIGVGFFVVTRIITHLGQVYNLSPALCVLLPVLGFAAIGFLGIRYAQR